MTSKPTHNNTNPSVPSANASSKILPDEDVDELILSWLQKRKLTDTLDVLRLELASRGETGSGARSSKRSRHIASLDADLVENGLLVSISNPEGSAGAYASQFRQLSTWILNSLDEYKSQLNQLLYPTFVYAYVTMIQLEADTAAQELLAESKDLFLNQTSNSARRDVLLKEIHEFSKIKTPEDFDSFENDVLRQKVAVTLSRYTYELLMQFLRQEKLILMSSLLNRWFKIVVVQDFDEETMLGFWSASANVVAADGQHESTVEKAGVAGGNLAGEKAKAGGKAGKSVHANATTITSKQLELLKDSPYLKFQEITLRERIRRFEERVAGIEEDTKEHKEAVRRLDAMKGTLVKLGEKGVGRGDGTVPLPKRSALLQNWEEMEAHVTNWLDVVDGVVGGSSGGSVGVAPPCAFATVLNSHNSLNAAGMSSDFATLVGGFADSVVRLYDLTDGGNGGGDPGVTCLYGHTGPIYAVDMYKDANNKDMNGGTYESNPLVLSGSGDGSVRLWSAELETNLIKYQGHVLPVWDVSFSESSYGHYFASGGADKTCRMWDTGRKTCLRVFAGHSSDVEIVKWHPNSQILASGGADGCVRLWDAASGGCVSVLSIKSPVTSVEFFARNNQCGELLVGDETGRLSRWDLRMTGGSISDKKVSSCPIWSISAANYKGNMYCCGGDDGCVRVFQEDSEFVEKYTWGTKATPVMWCGFGNFDSFILGVGALCGA